MHEYSIVQALLERVESEARARGASAVHGLSIRIGELSGVEKELLLSAYELVRETSPLAAGATLAIDYVPARWACRGCERGLERGALLRCPDCGQPARLVEGDEILLDCIELEVP